jgi:hypothetical protein
MSEGTNHIDREIERMNVIMTNLRDQFNRVDPKNAQLQIYLMTEISSYNEIKVKLEKLKNFLEVAP